MNDLDFQVTVDEANLILEGLGYLPFAKVYALVENLQLQAREQLRSAAQSDDSPASELVGGPGAGGSSNGDLHGR